MDSRQLSTFVTLAETLNYQRAAERLQYSPSSLFRHIQLLEEELGMSLFQKNGRQLKLTDEGKRLLPEAKQLLTGWKKFLNSAQESQINETISVGGCEMNTACSLYMLLSQFTQKYPDVHYSMTTSPNAAVPELLLSGLIDVGFYYSLHPYQAPGIRRVLLYREPLYICVSGDHPLLRLKSLQWQDLSGLPVVHPHASCCFITEYNEALDCRGCIPGHTSYLGSLSLVLEQAAREHALMLIPLHALERIREVFDVNALKMAEEPLYFWESLLFRENADISDSAKKLIRFSEEYAAQKLSENADLLKGPASYDTILHSAM